MYTASKSLDTLMTPIIYHIVSRAVWEQAASTGFYRADTLHSERFIHCSTAAQVSRVANSFYRGQRGLLLLAIDSGRLQAPLRYEAPAEDPTSEERFPHIYGPLNRDAVIDVTDFEPGPDGLFAVPRTGE